MARRRLVAVAAVVHLVTVLAACDAGGSDNQPTTPPTVSIPSDPNKAPSVPEPLDIDAFIDSPCIGLTRQQQKKYHLDSGEPDAVSAHCVYRFTNVDRRISIAYSDPGPDLQTWYDTRQHEERWEPEILDNYPAVGLYREYLLEDEEDDIPRACYYIVAVNNGQDLFVHAQDEKGGSECSLARKIAADLLSTIKNHPDNATPAT